MNIFKILILTSLIPFFACQQQPDYHEIKEDLSKSINELKSEIADGYKKSQEEIEELATQEMEKLFTIEYHVFELKLTDSTADHQNKLNEIGKDRWDCFFVDKTAEFYRVYCRRIPKSYLRYLSKIPNLIP